MSKQARGCSEAASHVHNDPSPPPLSVARCRCCPKKLQNILGSIKTHVSSTAHQDALHKYKKRNMGDDGVAKFLHEYFKKHPREKDSSVDDECQLYRWRAVEACMYAGIPLSKVDTMRTLLERGGTVSLTASSNLGTYIPKIEMFEYERLMNELKGQSVCLIYDGTTRLGECTAVLMRWCTHDFQLKQRLIALRTVKRHMSGDTLGPFLIDLIGQLGVRSQSIVCTARDSCATNGKAERNIKPILSNCESMMCVSHTLSHCAEHVDLPVLKEFMTPWLSLVQHHAAAKSLWKEVTGGTMKGFSTIRWFSREEAYNELALNFASLPNYVDNLLSDEIGDALTQKMKSILSRNGEALELELACTLDMERILTTCYSLEGDGLCILLARRKLDALLSWGDDIGQHPSTLPNVAALLRKKMKLEQGVKIYEYFADVTPPAWFTGVVVAPRLEGMITVRYEDNKKIDQDEHEVRQWIDVRELPEWTRLVAAAKSGITYLRNRMTGNLPTGQQHYDCSRMFQASIGRHGSST